MELFQYINPLGKSWGEVIKSTTRKEYWLFVLLFCIFNFLFLLLMLFLSSLGSAIFRDGIMYVFGTLWGVSSLVLGLYSIGLFIGRFNDAGFSPALGIVVLLSPIIFTFLVFALGGGVMILYLGVILFSFWVLVQPSADEVVAENPETVMTEVQDDEVSFTIEDVSEEAAVELSVETRRLIDWYVERHTDGVSREELVQAMRDAGHPEERITEVLQNV